MGPTLTTDSRGNKRWYLNEQFHREDGPAREYANGNKCWFLNGERHRADGPALEMVNGTKEWYLNGELHRVDGPAIERSNGTKEWYLNGLKVTPLQFRNHLKQIINTSQTDRIAYKNYIKAMFEI